MYHFDIAIPPIRCTFLYLIAIEMKKLYDIKVFNTQVKKYYSLYDAMFNLDSEITVSKL